MNPNYVTFDQMEAFWKDKLQHVVKQLVDAQINERLENDKRGGSTRRPMAGHPRRPALNNFGQENYDYLLMPTLSSILKSNNDLQHVIQKVVVDLFFNPDQKKNHTVYIPVDSYKCINIYKDNNWKPYQLEPTLERIVRRANDVLQHYIVGSDENEEKVFQQEIGKKRFEALKEFTDKIDNMEDFQDFRIKLLKDTEHTITTFQHIVHQRTMEPPSSD